MSGGGGRCITGGGRERSIVLSVMFAAFSEDGVARTSDVSGTVFEFLVMRTGRGRKLALVGLLSGRFSLSSSARRPRLLEVVLGEGGAFRKSYLLPALTRNRPTSGVGAPSDAAAVNAGRGFV